MAEATEQMTFGMWLAQIGATVAEMTEPKHGLSDSTHAVIGDEHSYVTPHDIAGHIGVLHMGQDERNVSFVSAVQLNDGRRYMIWRDFVLGSAYIVPTFRTFVRAEFVES